MARFIFTTLITVVGPSIQTQWTIAYKHMGP